MARMWKWLWRIYDEYSSLQGCDAVSLGGEIGDVSIIAVASSSGTN